MLGELAITPHCHLHKASVEEAEEEEDKTSETLVSGVSKKQEEHWKQYC